MCDDLSDNDDIRREFKNLLVRTKMLISRSYKCYVKLTLFKSFCMALHDVALWKKNSFAVFNKFRSCNNRCIKKLFEDHRHDSMCGFLVDVCLPTANTVVHNSCFLFSQLCSASYKINHTTILLQ